MNFIEGRTTLEVLVSKLGLLIKEGNVDLAAIEVLLTSIDLTLQDMKNELDLKMQRIQNQTDYRRVYTYVGAFGGPTANLVNTITHTATTYLGAEQIVETYSYVNIPGGDYRIDNIQYSL